MNKVPNWSELIDRYKKENIRYISENKKKLLITSVLGIIAAAISIGLSYLTLPGSIFLYYFALIFTFCLIFPSNSERYNKYPMAISFSIEISDIILSLLAGLSIVSVFSGYLTVFGALSSFLYISAFMLVFMPLYGIFISVSGLLINEFFDNTKNKIRNSNTKENKDRISKEDTEKNIEKSKSYN